jgi:hypothetical protein
MAYGKFLKRQERKNEIERWLLANLECAMFDVWSSFFFADHLNKAYCKPKISARQERINRKHWQVDRNWPRGIKPLSTGTSAEKKKT